MAGNDTRHFIFFLFSDSISIRQIYQEMRKQIRLKYNYERKKDGKSKKTSQTEYDRV